MELPVTESVPILDDNDTQLAGPAVMPKKDVGCQTRKVAWHWISAWFDEAAGCEAADPLRSPLCDKCGK